METNRGVPGCDEAAARREGLAVVSPEVAT